MSNMQVDRRFIENTLKNWGSDNTEALLEALRVDLRRNLRKCSKDEAPVFESSIEQMDTEDFWLMLDIITNYQFTP